MELQWWQDWYGWLITTAFAALAAIAAIAQEVRHVRGRPNAVLWLERAGEVTRGDERWERFKFANIGTASVRLIDVMIFGARPASPEADTFRLPRTIPVGDERHIVVVPGGTDDAWVLVSADHPHRAGWAKVWWLPLNLDGPLGETFSEENAARDRVRARLARRIRRDRRPVQPGGRNVATMRLNDVRRLRAAIPAAVEGWSLLG